MKGFVRWIGAFGKAPNLHESLSWELSQDREIACEKISGQSHIFQSRIGLKLDSRAVIRVFNGDCFSIVSGKKLVKTRNPRNSHSLHREAWALPVYDAIVLKDKKHINISCLKTVRYFSKSHNLPVIELETGKIISQDKLNWLIEKKGR